MAYNCNMMYIKNYTECVQITNFRASQNAFHQYFRYATYLLTKLCMLVKVPYSTEKAGIQTNVSACHVKPW